MSKTARIVLIVTLWVLGALAGHEALASSIHRDQLNPAFAHVQPYYNVGPGHAAFLVLHAGPAENNVVMFFYDQDCTLRVDFATTLTDFDTFFLDLEDGFKEQTGIPFEGAILLFQTDGGVDGFTSTVVNVNIIDGTASTWPSIPLKVGGVQGLPSIDWLLYDRQVWVTFGPKDDGVPFSTVLTLSCPQGDLGDDMVNISELVGSDLIDPQQPPFPLLSFEPHSGLLDMFVFDIDEQFIGSIHNVECRCFERKRLQDWTSAALTQDVVIYIQDRERRASTAGFQETRFQKAGLNLFNYQYLNHEGFFFGEDPVPD